MKGKKRKPNLMSLPDQPTTMEIPTDTFQSQWCCNCGLRHIVHFEVKRGKTKKKDSVVFRTWMDELGTKLGRFYEKYTKHRGKGAKK